MTSWTSEPEPEPDKANTFAAAYNFAPFVRDEIFDQQFYFQMFKFNFLLFQLSFES